MIFKLLSINVALASGWATCEFPGIDWIVVDQGVGKSATQKVAGYDDDVFITGYAANNLTLTSSKDGTTALKTVTESMSDKAPALQISKLKSSDGQPLYTKSLKCDGCGGTPSIGVIHGIHGQGLALGGSTSGNLTLAEGKEVIGDGKSLGYIAFLEAGANDVDTFKWVKPFPASHSSAVMGVDGTSMFFASYKTCEPCLDESTCKAELYYGEPTGRLLPTCTTYLGAFSLLDGATSGNGLWQTQMPEGVSLGYIRASRAENEIYAIFSASSDFALDGVDVAKGGGVLKFSSVNGTLVWGVSPADGVGASYIDISPADSNPVLAIAGGFSGIKLFGSKNITNTFGPYGSYIARMSTTDGSILWAEAVPMSRGVQCTKDNLHVGVFSQLTGTSNKVDLTDANGVTTTLRSRGSWDLIAIKLAAADGAGIFAIDGGGDNMEYFHGFGMTEEGDMLISGYSRSSVFHFGTSSLPNTADDSQNKVFTIQVSKDSVMPTCVASCSDDTPAVKANKCFIDHYCYDDSSVSTYPANACFTCNASASQTEWTGPDLSAHCFIDDTCVADTSAKPGASSRSPPSACQMCDISKSTSAWSIRDQFDYVGTGRSASCVALKHPDTSDASDALKTAMSASTAVKTITGSDGMGAGFAEAKTQYVGSVLQTLAKTGWAGTADFDAAVTYYGSATWLDDYMLSALDGTGQFSGELAPASRGPMKEARTEAVKKGVQDQILVMACISSVASDVSKAANWDLAYAYWYGDTPSGAPFARADKRCKNYGTCAADGMTAKANFKVLQAIADGKAAAEAGEAADATAAYNALRAAAYGVYYQAALRYSFKMDTAMKSGSFTADYQGEGGAFWRVIAPIMNAKDAIVSAYVNDFYTMTNAPNGVAVRYCPLLYLLSNNMLSGFTADDMGTLEDTEAVKCMAGVQLPSDVSAALTTAMSASTVVKTITGSDGMGAGFAEAKTQYVGSVLQTLAKTEYAGSPYFVTAKAYFEKWLDAYMLSALDGTGQFAGELAPVSRGLMSDARTEAVKKGVQDQILVNAALSTIQASGASASEASWYMFYAYWTGDTPGGAPWARANKRCKNYGTCGGMTSGANGEDAIVNSKILIAVLSALLDPSANGASAKATVEGQVMIVYYQAALRYSYKMDVAIAADGATADYQGEGGAFWRVIAPTMNGIDATTSGYVNRYYTMTTVPSGTNHFCPLRAMLTANLPNGTEAADMGTLEGTSAVECATIPKAGASGVVETSMTIKAPGSVSDYVAADIAGATAANLGVDPTQVSVTITAASRRMRRLQSGGGVIITITIITLEADAAAVVTSMTNMAGSAALASTFLSEATGRTVTVTDEPSAPSTNTPSSGLSTGALIGIIVGVVVGVLVLVGIVYMMTKKKKKGGASGKKVASSGGVSA